MAKTKAQKKAIVEGYLDKINASKAVFLIRPKGLTANQSVEFKKKLYALDSAYHVVKNTLFKIALEKSELPSFDELQDGPNAIVFSGEDVTAVAKLVKEYSKELTEVLTLGPGIMEGALLSASQVNDLADMPPKEVIIAQIAGILNNPMSGVVNVLEDSVRSVAIILDKAFQN